VGAMQCQWGRDLHQEDRELSCWMSCTKSSQDFGEDEWVLNSIFDVLCLTQGVVLVQVADLCLWVMLLLL